MNSIIRVNTRSGKVEKSQVSAEEMRWGGRLLISKFLLREVPPTCDPLGRFNKLLLPQVFLETPLSPQPANSHLAERVPSPTE